MAAIILFLTLLFTATAHAATFTNAAPIHNLSPESAEARHPVSVRGVVTCSDLSMRLLFIHDGNSGIYVYHPGPVPNFGSDVEITGVTGKGLLSPIVIANTLTVLGSVPLPVPRQLQFSEIADKNNDSQWVETEATVLNQFEHAGNLVLTLAGGATRLEARVLNFDRGAMPNWTNERIRIRGVAAASFDEERRPAGYNLMVQNAGLITVLPRTSEQFVFPPPRRLGPIVGLLSTLLVAAGAWIFFLKGALRKQAAAIRRREASLDDIFQNANDIIYSHDLSGRLTSMNKSGLAAFGYTLEELKGLTIFDLIDSTDHERARNAMESKLGGAPRTAYELSLRTRSGERLVFEVNSRLQLKDDLPAGIQGIARDITARKKAEEALRQSERQLRASLEQRESLARDLHDGIIQSIYATGLNLDDCARITVQDPHAVEVRLRKAVSDLNRVIRDVRNFIVGLESHRVTGEEFKTALKSLALTVDETQQVRIELNINDTAAASLTSAQATQLLLIAREALGNAIRHGNPQCVTIHLAAADNRVHFEVVDDGVGFNPAVCQGKGFGLRNMASRAKEIQANYQLISQTGEGTRIALDIRTESSEESRGENSRAHR